MGEILATKFENRKSVDKMAPLSVPVLEEVSLDEVLSKIKEREPVLIRHWDIGSCVHKWSFEYVRSKTGNEPVKIHVSDTGKMDFVKKNFVYKTLPFDELISRISQTRHENYFISPNEYYYLRSLGKDPRGKTVANFFEHFPGISEDFKLPPFFDEKDLFSSVLRVSSKGLQLWTHYDIMDNILVQVKGVKRVILWPPSEVNKMYMTGDKSEVLEVDDPDPVKYPKFLTAVRYEGIMQPGDVLFIPALWFHNTIALEASLGVNIFWKNLPHDLYDKNDSYGNKDLLPGAKGLRSVQTAIASLKNLPVEYKDFYIRRMIKMLEDELPR